jgi:hypothetical protein
MAEDTSLRDFILGYCQQVGGLVEPPAYGVYEVLLPEDVAARWGIDSFQRLNFDPAFISPLPPDVRGESVSSPAAWEEAEARSVITLYYGHPLVEIIVFELRQRPADTRLFINPRRLEKPGLRELVEKTFTFSNARPATGHIQGDRLYHYICFNFKASLVSDEKREMVVSLWMHLQGGYRLPSSEIQSRVSLDPKNATPQLMASPPTWHKDIKPGENPFTPEILTALLDRARLAVLDEIAPVLESARKRSQHFLVLDRARLGNYYADLQHDLEKRLSKAEDERQPALKSKLVALQDERQSKLADAEHKYRLHVDLELINLAIIAQPKIEIDVEINKRGLSIIRPAAWDPVRHLLEPLVCDVCGQPGEGLTLCESGHLAHAACLAPQCTDCKRAFCKLCSEKVHTCVVCDAPVCLHSLMRCKTCGRETCQKHLDLCHAADGQPQRITMPPPAPAEQAAPLPVKTDIPTAKDPKSPKTTGKARTPPVKKHARPYIVSQPKAVTAQRIQVEIEGGKAEVRAFALSKEREIAVRIWELAGNGITTNCLCEKGWRCGANEMIHRPADAEQIEAQLRRLIRALADEYSVPEKKISFLRMAYGRFIENRGLILGPNWKNPATLAAAQASFDKRSSPIAETDQE